MITFSRYQGERECGFKSIHGQIKVINSSKRIRLKDSRSLKSPILIRTKKQTPVLTPPRTGFPTKPALSFDATTVLCPKVQLEKCSLEMSAEEPQGTPRFQVQNMAKNEHRKSTESPNDSVGSGHVTVKTLSCTPSLSPHFHVLVTLGMAGSAFRTRWIQVEYLPRR